jgi:hypothetical protein
MIEGANTFENLNPLMKTKYTRIKKKIKSKGKQPACCCDTKEKSK